MKIFTSIFLFVLLFSACQQRVNDEWIKSSPNLKVPIVFYFKKGTTYAEINSFRENVIGIRHPEGRGYGFINGIQGLFSVRNQDYEGFALDRINENERENILKAINSSPVVYKVFENVVPNEIILDAAKAKMEKEELEKAKQDNRPTKTFVVTNSTDSK